MDYIVTDRIASPPRLAHLYTEKLAYMVRTALKFRTPPTPAPFATAIASPPAPCATLQPHSFFVNDHAQSYHNIVAPMDDATVAEVRTAFGLPQRPAVVYCMFNQLYKVDPASFACWVRILLAVPGSVLWLLYFPEAAEPNLRREAAARGLAPERLVFSPLEPKAGYIARAQVADLFLDTPSCNAHTTVRSAPTATHTAHAATTRNQPTIAAVLLLPTPCCTVRRDVLTYCVAVVVWIQGTDMLWAGVPILTRPGDTMASRICSSLNHAIGMEELVVGCVALPC